eukprot:PhF_6_TR23750/c0_g1_i1/m.33188
MSRKRIDPSRQTESGSSNTFKYITGSDFQSLPKREKPLPHDANKEGSKYVLFQLQEHIRHKCALCGKDNIHADVVAFEGSRRTFQCARCYERLVRPRKFQALRVNPFPSLVSWLYYDRNKAPVKAKVTNEAFYASGNRVAQNLVHYDKVSDVPNLPGGLTGGTTVDATPTTNALWPTGPNQSATSDLSHPCLRVWGACKHGSSCRLQGQPRNLCILYLAGLCLEGPQCPHQHISVEGLPRPDDIPSNIPSKASLDYYSWLEQRRTSPNPLLMQIWNNGSLHIPDAREIAAVKEKRNTAELPEDAQALQRALKMLA